MRNNHFFNRFVVEDFLENGEVFPKNRRPFKKRYPMLVL